MSATSPKSFLLISECDFIWQQCHEYWTSTLSQVNCVYQNEKFIFNILPELFSFVQIVKKQQGKKLFIHYKYNTKKSITSPFYTC